MSSMTDSSFTLPPLPELQVIRDTWCSQELTDKVIRFLEQERPELIQHVAREQIIARDTLYNHALDKVSHYLVNDAASIVAIPLTRLGRLDLLFELSRRIANALGRPKLELVGNPIAEGPHSPLVPLINAPESKWNTVPIEILDKVVQATYEQRPDLLYETAEQMRRGILLSEIQGEILSYWHDELDKVIGVPYQYRLGIYANIQLRVHLMMGLPLPLHFISKGP